MGGGGGGGGGGNSRNDDCIGLDHLGLEVSLQCLMDNMNPLVARGLSKGLKFLVSWM